MKRIFFALTAAFLCLLTNAQDVTSARISKAVVGGAAGYIGEKLDKKYTKDFTAFFRDIDFSALEASDDDGVFGMPVTFIVCTTEGDYIVTMNNTHGCFTITKAKEDAKGVYRPSENDEDYKDVYLPELYDALVDAGINILSAEELDALHSLPNKEQQERLKDYTKIKKTK